MIEYTVKVNELGYEAWYLHGKLHREDGPALSRPDGKQQWYLNGQRHREGGPAITKTDGYEAWYVHGKLHRKGGPAVIHVDGSESWYLNGAPQQNPNAIKEMTVAEIEAELGHPVKVIKE